MRCTWLSFLLVVACHQDAPAPPMEASPVEVQLPESSTFTVHEWGFIGHHYASGREAPLSFATGRGRRATVPTPPVAPRPRTRVHGDEGRPVVYIHFDEPARPMEIRAILDIGEGTMVEHLPTADHDGSRYRWDITAHHGSCTGVARYPAGGNSRCGGRPDGYCEASFLATYQTDDAACLEVDGDRWYHLFYRTQVQAALPIEVSRREGSFVVRAHDALPGKLMHIRRGERLHDTRVHIFDAPAPGEELVLPAETEGTPIDAQRFLETELRARGMSDAESHAFMRGWVVDLLGSNTEVSDRVQDMRAPENLAAKSDALVYFMPEDAVQAMAPLQFEPPAREVRRAILVRVDLGEVPEPRAVQTATGRRERVSVLSPSVEGSWRHMDRALQAARVSLELCYEDVLEGDGSATGLAEVHVRVGADGTTSDMEIRWRAGGSVALAACLANVVGESMGPPPSRAARLVLPILFDPR